MPSKNAKPHVYTLEEIHAATRAYVPCLAGGGVTVRRISSAEYLRCYPPPLEVIAEEPPEARAARETEWKKLHADALAEVPFRLLAIAAVEPKLTLDDARGFGDAAGPLAIKVLELYDASQVPPDAA